MVAFGDGSDGPAIIGGAAESEARVDALFPATSVAVEASDVDAASDGSGSVCGTGSGPMPEDESAGGTGVLAGVDEDSPPERGRTFTSDGGVERSAARLTPWDGSSEGRAGDVGIDSAPSA